MKADEIEVTIISKIDVDKKTALTCLLLANIYANNNGLKISQRKNESGETEYFYEPDRRF